MNRAIATLLNKVLGDWIENLNPEQLKLSVFKGKIELKSLKLKPLALVNLGLPFHLENGYVGNIDVDVPWTSLNSSPLIINIQNVYALINPKPPEDWSETDERKIALNAKIESLANFEALNQPEFKINKDMGYIQKLVETIVNNLQINIKNVYLRYEDNKTSETPFVIGVKLEEIVAFSCNSEWKPMFVKESKKYYKSVKITNLSVFLDYKSGVILCRETYRNRPNEALMITAKSEFAGEIPHKYVICPFSCNIELVIDKNSLENEANYKIQVNQDNFSLQLYIDHISYIIKLLDYYNLFKTFTTGIQNSLNLNELDESLRETYKQKYLLWKNENSKNSESPNSLKFKKELEELEKFVKLENLKFLRTRAIDEEIFNKKIQEKIAEINKIKNKEKGTASKISNFFSSKAEIEKERIKEEELKKEKISALENEMLQIEKEKNNPNLDFKIEELASSSAILLWLKFNLDKASIKIFNPSLLLSSDFENFSFSLILKSLLPLIEISLQSLKVKDHQNLTEICDFIIDSKPLELYYSKERLKLRTFGMDVFLSVVPLLNLVNLLKLELSSRINLDKFIAEASTATSKYIEIGENYVKDIVKNGSTVSMDLNLSIKAPNIYIANENMQHFINIDLGNLELSSASFKGKHDYYDLLKILLTQVKISTVWDMKSLKHWEKFDEILKPANIKVNGRMYRRKNKEKIGYKFITELGNYVIQISDKQISLILSIFNLLIPEKQEKIVTEAILEEKIGESFENEEINQKKEVMIEGTDEVMPWSFQLKWEGFEIALIKSEISLIQLKVSKAKLQALSNHLQKINMTLELENLKVIDPQASIFQNILQKVSSASRIHFKIIFDSFPAENTKIISICLNETLVTLPRQFVSDVISYFSDLIQILPLVASENKEKKVTSRVKQGIKSSISVRLIGIQLDVPICGTNSSKVMTLGLSSLIFYNSNSLYEILLNQNMEVSRNLLSSLDEISISLTHFYMNVSDFTTNTDLKSILSPTRLSLDYISKFSEKNYEQEVNIRIESIFFTIGFYDIAYFKAILNEYLSLIPKSSENLEGKEKFDTKMICNIDGDSFQLDIQDDMTPSIQSMAHLQLSNLSVLVIFNPTSKQISMNSLLFCIFYNKQLGAWEPLIEDWKLEVDFSQESLTSPMILSVKSEDFLNINANLSILSGLFTAITYLNQEIIINNSPIYLEQSENSFNCEFNLVNALEFRIKVQLNCLGNNQWWEIEPNGAYSFTQKFIENLLARSNPDFKSTSTLNSIQPPITINLQINDFNPITGIIIEKIGLFLYLAENNAGNTCFAIDISANGPKRCIKILSSVEICNNSNYSIVFECHGNTLQVPEKTCRNVPLTWKQSLEEIFIFSNNSKEKVISTKFVGIVDKFHSVNLYKYKSDTDIFYKTIEISPCFSIKNLLPCEIGVLANENLIFQLNTGDEKNIEDIDPQKELKLQIKLLYDENFTFFSEEFLLSDKKDLIELKDLQGSSIKLKYLELDPIKNSGINLSMRNREAIGDKEAIHSTAIVFYSEIILLNKSDSNLLFSEVDLPKHSWRPYNKSRGKVECKDFPSKPSKNFNLETISVSGLLNIPHKSESFELNLGVSINLSSFPLEQTKIVTIVPRYLVSNLTKFPIFIKRNQGFETITLNSQETRAYEPGVQNTSICISADSQNWSGLFELETIEDFQIKFLKSAEQRNKVHKNNSEKWNRSDFHYVRVMIYTNDEATVYISFSKSKDPEYLINNLTNDEIIVNEVGNDQNYLKILPNQALPWVFDNCLAKEKKIKMTISGTSGVYSLDKIKMCKKILNYNVEVLVQGITRVMRVHPQHDQAASALVKSQKNKANTFKFIAKFVGIGLSVMDLKNSEQIYVSVSDILIKYKIINKSENELWHQTTKIDVLIESFQIDNMDTSGKLFPVILSPVLMEEDKNDENRTPFFQFKFQKDFISSPEEKISLEKITWMELSMQPFQVKMNEETIYALMALKELSTAFSSLSVAEKYVIDTASPLLPLTMSQIQRKAYFQFLRISAIKFDITFRKSLQPVKIGFRSGLGMFRVLGAIGGAFANISETPIKYTEVMVTHGFQTMATLVSTFSKNYLRQTIMQVYKILGSSDMIGNPLGLIDKLGTGVFEFVSEPAKGLLKGPKAFASGVGKGVKSLVGGIVAGGFGSISKITGSLYNVINEVGGDQRLERKSEKIGTFMFEGFKGGVMDIAHGVTGVFSKPYKGAKDSGAKGFIKGVGSGLFGLVSSPFKFVLRVGNTVSTGIASSATLLAKGKVYKYGRVRFPRHVAANGILVPYESEIAQVQQLLLQEGDAHTLIQFIEFKEKNEVMIILTNKLLWVLIDAETSGKVPISSIETLELFRNENNYVLTAKYGRDTLNIYGNSFGKLKTAYYSIVSVIGHSKLTSKKKNN